MLRLADDNCTIAGLLIVELTLPALCWYSLCTRVETASSATLGATAKEAA